MPTVEISENYDVLLEQCVPELLRGEKKRKPRVEFAIESLAEQRGIRRNGKATPGADTEAA